jgi:5-formyltetrahydrofolate cyclo-ligase
VDAIVLPALAVDPATGVRLGRGGGAYDRLLSTLPATVGLLALLGDDTELMDLTTYTVWHDRAVHAVATPTALHRCRREPA